MSPALKRRIALVACWFAGHCACGVSGFAVAAGATPAEDRADFRPACETARGLRQPMERSVGFGRTLRAWIAQDPAAALAYVRALPPGADYTQGLSMVLEEIGHRDPDRALALAGELVATREQRAIYSSLFAQLAAADPQAAAKKLALVPAGEGRENALRALADGWTRSDANAALAWAQSLDPVEGAPALESVLGALAQRDPWRALKLARQSLTGPGRDRVVATALQGLATTDVRAAALMVNRRPADESQALTVYEVARALAVRDPAEALAWTRSLPDSDLQRIALNNVLEVWAFTDSVSAANYVAQMPAGRAQCFAAGHLARLLAARDPPAAIAWAQALPRDGTRESAVVGIVSVWARRDPVHAARWAAAAPDLALRAEALSGALSIWMLSDAAAVRTFVSALTDETQVRAAASVAPDLAQTDPPGAMEWARTLASPEARAAAMTAAFARWLGNDRVAATAWLAAASLPAEVKGRLLPPALP